MCMTRRSTAISTRIEEIEELIRKGKLQKFVKKGDSSGSRGDNKDKHEAV